MVQLLRLPEVCRRVGLSKSTIYSLIAARSFVPAVSISARCRAWPSDAVDAWIQARIAEGATAAAPRQATKRNGAGLPMTNEAPIDRPRKSKSAMTPMEGAHV
jgi:prophage regulatory protein